MLISVEFVLFDWRQLSVLQALACAAYLPVLLKLSALAPASRSLPTVGEYLIGSIIQAELTLQKDHITLGLLMPCQTPLRMMGRARAHTHSEDHPWMAGGC